MATEVDRG